MNVWQTGHVEYFRLKVNINAYPNQGLKVHFVGANPEVVPNATLNIMGQHIPGKVHCGAFKAGRGFFLSCSGMLQYSKIKKNSEQSHVEGRGYTAVKQAD